MSGESTRLKPTNVARKFEFPFELIELNLNFHMKLNFIELKLVEFVGSLNLLCSELKGFFLGTPVIPLSYGKICI